MTTAALTPAARSLPRFGGFSLGMIGLELRRTMRNRRTVMLTLILPPLFYILFGTNTEYRRQSIGHGGNVTGYVLISMAVYGAMIATTTGGARVSIERAAGWSRQLRLTPLHPAAYVAVKIVLAMITGLVSVAVVLVVGVFTGARLPMHAWIECGLLSWACALVFAAFGLFMGYLLPSENVMQVLGPILAVLAFAGGLFTPLDDLGHIFATVAKFTPAYGVGAVVRYPLTHEGNIWVAALNAIAWTLVFAAGAMWRFRRDTARV
jgi:ABC-2 type transport system permease protein